MVFIEIQESDETNNIFVTTEANQQFKQIPNLYLYITKS